MFEQHFAQLLHGWFAVVRQFVEILVWCSGCGFHSDKNSRVSEQDECLRRNQWSRPLAHEFIRGATQPRSGTNRFNDFKRLNVVPRSYPFLFGPANPG